MTGGLGPRVLVTVPVFNEAPRIGKTLATLRKALRGAGLNYTLSVSEDGSTDGTKDMLALLQSEDSDLLVQTHPSKKGRGWALRTLWTGKSYDVFAFCDADLASGPEALVEAINLAISGQDIVVGSRHTTGSSVHRPPVRNIVSHAYNAALRAIFNTGILDHQCGLKVFNRTTIENILPLSLEDSWFWDTEILVIAKAVGIHVYEMPVDWVETKNGRTQLRRLLSDVYLHGTGILRLKSRSFSLPPNRKGNGNSATLTE